ncbi:hypothetical protein L1887_34927 [Cichorium endivia]|nr:hypothetical protein L1887_34927 [Cichorium endivia]
MKGRLRPSAPTSAHTAAVRTPSTHADATSNSSRSDFQFCISKFHDFEVWFSGVALLRVFHDFQMDANVISEMIQNDDFYRISQDVVVSNAIMSDNEVDANAMLEEDGIGEEDDDE